MKIARTLGVALLALALLVVGIGVLLPEEHSVSRERVLAAEPARVFAVISTPSDFPAWRSGVERVELLSTSQGSVRFREIGSDGSITYAFDEWVPEQRLVSRIADEGLPFGGTWTFELRPGPEGTLLRITEDGQVHHPVYRFMARFVFGHHRTIDRYLTDLEAQLNRTRTP